MHDIVDTAVAAGTFKTLAAAVTAAGLVDTLKGAGPFTVFAPSDDAFAKLPAGTVEALLADIPTHIHTYLPRSCWQGHGSGCSENERSKCFNAQRRFSQGQHCQWCSVKRRNQCHCY